MAKTREEIVWEIEDLLEWEPTAQKILGSGGEKWKELQLEELVRLHGLVQDGINDQDPKGMN